MPETIPWDAWSRPSSPAPSRFRCLLTNSVKTVGHGIEAPFTEEKRDRSQPSSPSHGKGGLSRSYQRRSS
jgi:hypothetical protein